MTVQFTFARLHIWENIPFQKERGADGKTFLFNPSPGHVALEIHTGGPNNRIVYISFWPPTQKCCAATTSHFHSDYQTDKNAEGGRDSQRFDIQLSREGAEKIINAFSQFLANDYSWSKFGSSVFSRSHERNCVGLTLDLLKIGKVDIDSHYRTKAYRVGIALFTSLIIFGSLNLFAYQKIPQLQDSLAHYKALLNSLTRLDFVNGAALKAFQEISDAMQEVITKYVDTELPEQLLGIQEALQNECTILSGATEMSEQVIPALKNNISILQKQLYVSIGTLISPLILGLTGTMLNQRIWLKTYTPSDVKNIACSIQNQQAEEKNNSTNYALKFIGGGFSLGLSLYILNRFCR